MKHQMEVRLSPEEAFDLYVYEGSELGKTIQIVENERHRACNVKHNIALFLCLWRLSDMHKHERRPSGRNPPSSNR